MPVKIEVTAKALVIDGVSSVEMWEAPIQNLLVQSIVNQSDIVLEVGYGLGIASNAIVERHPSQHWLVEQNVEVISATVHKRPNFTGLIATSWECAMPVLRNAYFDAIVFDPDPSNRVDFDGSVAATFQFIRSFLPEAARLLTQTGRLGFIDFSANITLHQAFLKALEQNDLWAQPIPVPTNGPDGCIYAKSQVTHVVRVAKLTNRTL